MGRILALTAAIALLAPPAPGNTDAMPPQAAPRNSTAIALLAPPAPGNTDAMPPQAAQQNADANGLQRVATPGTATARRLTTAASAPNKEASEPAAAREHRNAAGGVLTGTSAPGSGASGPGGEASAPGNGASGLGTVRHRGDDRGRDGGWDPNGGWDPDAVREALDIPRVVDGHRANVGLIVLGHSTSDQGDYPQKLALALNANPADGRNYQVFELITGGDGGFLWSQAKFVPGELQYHRVAASSTQQWCTDTAGNRWSVRRVKVDRALTGSGDPTGGACANTAPPSMTCTYYDATGPKTATGFATCLSRMDIKLALIQDTTNRSWPIDDWNLDGAITTADTWPAARIPDTAEPCGNGRPGVVNARIDWNCDGALTAQDASHTVYAGWLERFSQSLLSHVDHVFISQKPLEFGATCPNYPASEQPNCRLHATRAPTPSRPFDHFYNPLVYWEWRAIQALTTKSTLDPRIHHGEISLRRMHLRSDDCYDSGITTWSIPAAVPGRPTTITADDDEWQGGQEADAENTGCMRADHIHHNSAGGWLMADVWYEGLTPYLNG